MTKLTLQDFHAFFTSSRERLQSNGLRSPTGVKHFILADVLPFLLPANSSTYYEVRIEGDGEHAYLVESPVDGEYGETRYDATDLESAKRYAKFCSGWVVQVTEATVYEPKHDDGIVPANLEDGDDET